MINEQTKKVVRVALKVLAWAVAIVSVFMMIFTIVSVTVFDRNDRNLFGYSMFIVKSDSMSATDFCAGDLIFVKGVDVADLDVGDIITFQTTDPDFFQNGENTYGMIITHKIRDKQVDEKGNISFTTYGTTTGVDDPTPVAASFVLGVYRGKIPYAGTFFNFLRSTPGYFVCILLPFLLLLVIQGCNTVKLFQKYKKEQMADIEEERRKVAAEREETQRLLAELRAMKGEIRSETQGDVAGTNQGGETQAPSQDEEP